MSPSEAAKQALNNLSQKKSRFGGMEKQEVHYKPAKVAVKRTPPWGVIAAVALFTLCISFSVYQYYNCFHASKNSQLKALK